MSKKNLKYQLMYLLMVALTSGLVYSILSLESGHVVKPTNGWYAKVNQDTGEVGDKKRYNDTQTAEFWNDILSTDSFKTFVRKKYEITYGSIMGNDPVLETEDEEV